MSIPPHAFSFSNAKFDPGVLRVAEFSGQEAMSRLFRFDVTLAALQADVAFGDIVNKPASLAFTEGNAPHRVSGLVVDFEQRGFRSDFALYRAVLVPRAWLLTLTHQSRIFQQMSIPEIIEDVLQGAGIPSTGYRLDLRGSYEPREYVTQFEETDWAFISRWMEHLGIFFYFEHEDDGDVLVIADDSAGCPEADLQDDIAFHPETGTLTDTEGQPTIEQLSFRERVATGLVLLNDYNPHTPDTDLRTTAEADGEMPGKRYEYGGPYANPSEGDALAKVRAEELAAQRTVLSGGSNITAFRPGHTFALDLGAGFRADLSVSWLLTGVEHFGSQRSGLATAGGVEGATYRNTFSCIPASVPYRPPRLTPVPHVPGVMSAVTETAGGDYAHLNEDGDYKGRFKWDVGIAPEAGATKWMRMRQAYSGPGYGIHFPNHPETEMVVAFENGHPDRPLILGTVENKTQKSPVTSDNKTQNLIRTFAGNQILLEDKRGVTKIVLTTPGGHSVSLDDGHPQITVATSGGNVLTMDDKDDKIVLNTKAGHTLYMDDVAKDIQLYTPDKHVLAMSDQEQVIVLRTKGEHMVRMDDGGKTIKVKTTDGHEVELSDQENKIEVKTKSGDNSIEMNEGEGRVASHAKDLVAMSAGENGAALYLSHDGIVMLTGKNVNIVADDTVTISGKQIAIKGQQEAKMGVGTQSVTFNNQKVEVAGAAITSAAVGVHEITGAMVKIN